MVVCRFEDAVGDRTLNLCGFVTKVTACSAQELPTAVAEIEQYQREGHWIALKLNYSLGEWLEPALRRGDVQGVSEARFSAYVFERCDETRASAESSNHSARIVSAKPRLGFVEYREKILNIKSRIENGDVYQVNFTLPIDVIFEGSPIALYQTLIEQHPVSHAAYIDDGESAVLSISPELFVERRGNCLTSRPMKGTAPRHHDPEEDARSAYALRNSPKDRAENAMIVDLLRNDMGRIAQTGGVRVESLFDLERYPSVWTLTSTIKADIGSASFMDVLRAMFPCGSIVGAPKIAAMRCIDELELSDRGLYCGSIGWMSPTGDYSLNVAIRTLVLKKDGTGVYGVGGGIVIDSEPSLEWSECQWKSRVIRGSTTEIWQ
ncbi:MULTISPECIES: aminodeoxychorismate synthase component I [Burkholderia cepacia complex]|uniref:aminodeoxychorismate synthase component I n=1 Tax=Burkholderia cepacia complex TaxID=87882 RepID=UPI0006186E64|nr:MULTISPECIES: aminodeoxychorismate synthase component I [Burkholderia cepacia complex]MDO5947601.1 aminodeoxychorismate synthase component I [Burkholderia cepacia]MDS0807066.1 aminodeoxychorismate synthase component I [Burkholderia cenocepacia]GLZ73506.1 aminodeoxychorismate synthase, component I [Burkholderia contaminans]